MKMLALCRDATYDARQRQYDMHQSARTCYDTPAIREFLARPDVKQLQFPSGSVQVWVGDRPFVGTTLLEAVEAAMAFHLSV